MDGRIQEPVITWIKHTYHVDYVDVITEPGPVKFLATEPKGPVVESIHKRVIISQEKHGSDLIAIVAHDDCAGNPIDKKTQLHQLNTAADLIYTWGPSIEVIRLWVDINGTVEQIP